jgi:hypothetical protein
MRERDDLLIVLTEQTDADLGLGILARCYDQRVVTPSMMEAVKGAFRAHRVDSVLSRLSWVAEPLVRLAPSAGWPAAPGGTLTRDHALSQLTSAVLGLPVDELDPSGLLLWTLNPQAADRFREQPRALQDGVIDWIRTSIGPVAGIALRSTIQRHSVDAISLGLAADVLWSPGQQPDADVVAARARLESWTGVYGLDDATARAFADSARGALQRMTQVRDPAKPGIIARATVLFDDLRFPSGAQRSLVLPVGFEARIRSLAEQIQIFISAGFNNLASVEESFGELLRHEQSIADPRATLVPRMAVRLCRWLATPDTAPATSLDTALVRQIREFSYVDWASADVWVGSTDPEVAAAWKTLHTKVRERRDASDLRFANLLAAATASNVLPDALVPVERALSEILVPLTKDENRVLIVLVDGMSAAVAAELADEAGLGGWFEAVPASQGSRIGTLAVLPTLTRYSRTSFFTGALTSGGQAEERAGFAARTAGQVFHKADLVAEAGQALASPVVAAIDSLVPMIAVVLNTVDDTLSKADPGGTDWTLNSIQHLQPLLERAGAAGRTVVLISDHGHVVERGSQALAISGAEARFRPVGSGPVDPNREIELSGNRVLSEGGSIIAAVAEDIRYATKQAGYHGGASAAEVTIPIVVLSRQPEALQSAGWMAAPPQVPSWWNDTLAATFAGTANPARQATAQRRPKPAAAIPGQVGLDLEILSVGVTAPRVSVLEEVLASGIYLAQKSRYGARAADDDVVRAVLASLLDRSGRAHRDTLASAAGIPAARMTGTLNVLRRQLNIEGYEVLSIDNDEVTVVLDEALLREQFLEESL